jgi:outer membrane lipoprotein-sorting protein
MIFYKFGPADGNGENHHSHLYFRAGFLSWFCLMVFSFGNHFTAIGQTTPKDTIKLPPVNLLVDSIVSRQKAIPSLSSRLRQVHMVNYPEVQSIIYEGNVDYQAPNNILIHFLIPADEYMLAGDSVYTIYGVQNNFGITFHTSSLNPADKQIMAQMGQIKMNTLEIMQSGYLFSYGGRENGSCIINATPKSGWKTLSAIRILVDPSRLCVLAIELYGRDKSLTSQTIYSGQVRAGSSLSYFPKNIFMKTITGLASQIDSIEYTRTRFNVPFEKDHFSIPIPRNATIKDSRNAHE